MKEKARVDQEQPCSSKACAASHEQQEYSNDSEDSSSTDEVSSDTVEEFCNPHRKRSHHRNSKPGTPAFIPHDIMKRPRLAELATRLNMTPSQQASYTMALIEEAQGDTSKMSASYATTDRSRRTGVDSTAVSIRQHWIPPEIATLHWDSKIMPSLQDKYKKEERLVVIVGNADTVQLLGAPHYQIGSDEACGQVIADHTVNLLQSWNCSECIVNMTFDTTASNTGHVSAACVSIQQKLQKPLLWSGCRHHVGELILSHVFDDLKIEASKSPDVTLFVRFRKNFEQLPCSKMRSTLAILNTTGYSDEAVNFISDCRQSFLDKKNTMLQLCHDDYKEFVQLCIVFLDTSEDDTLITFNKPGALHKARWMSKLLYSIKLCLLENEINDLPRGTVTLRNQTKKIREFVNFVTLIYSSWWLDCSSTADAPWNDLSLYRHLLRYAIVNKEISQSAIKAFKRHLWYLTAEMAPLALFSAKVPEA
jgi:hypothetical protein